MPSDITDQNCPRCQKTNECAISAGLPASSCWCMQASAKGALLPASQACYCASCLNELTQQLTACADKP